MTAFVFVILGIALLLAGGTSLVRGASGVASSFGISPLIIGLTVVAFGTSAPELVVTLVSAARGYSGLAFGNVVGSNLANLGLVLGLSALVTPIAMHGDLVRREVPFLLLVTCITLVVCSEGATSAQAGQLDRAEGLVLLLLFLGFLYVTYLVTRARIEDPVIQGVQQLPVDPPRNGRNWISTIAGALLLAIGGHLTTTYGAQLAQQLGFAPVVVGLLIVAVGTSLPELTCSIIAAVKSEPDLCVGNVVGSNLFNSLLVLPAGALLRPMTIPENGLIDLGLTLGFAAALIPIFIFGRSRLGRPAGCLLLGAYLAFATTRIAFA